MATVLVVDDESSIASLVSEVLQREGHKVLLANSCSEALSMCRSHGEIDLLISDVVMPEMDGPDLARKIRAERPLVRVLLMSACCENRQATSFAFLPKPFTLTGLITHVRALMD